MKKAAFVMGVLVLLIPAAALLLRDAVPSLRNGPIDSSAPVGVRRILPHTSGNIVTAKPHQHCEFVYEVTNTSGRELKELSLQVNCQCQLLGDIPRELSPGEKATVGFSIRAPLLGETKETVLLTSAGRVVWPFSHTVRTEVEAPLLVTNLEEIKLLFVAGQDESRHVTVETIEESGGNPWLRSLDVEPSGLVELQTTKWRDLPYVDPGLVRRKYEFAFKLLREDASDYPAILRLQSSSGAAAPVHSGVLKVEVLDDFQAFPRSIDFSESVEEPGIPLQKRVLILNRTGEPAEMVVEAFDARLVAIENDASVQTSKVSAFLVQLIQPVQPGETGTSVVFSSGAGRTVTVPVMW